METTHTSKILYIFKLYIYHLFCEMVDECVTICGLEADGLVSIIITDSQAVITSHAMDSIVQ